jgi:rhodanese-related sulfurtransferase
VAIDVREPYELHDGFIPGAISVPAGRLIRRLRQPDTPRKLVFYCGRGDRSAIVASYLRHLGFENVLSLRDGIFGWQAAGLEMESPETDLDFEQIDVMTAFHRFERQGWTLIDVREADDFRRGHPPGARNLPLDDFIDDHVIGTLRELEPLLLICNTGNRSAMAAEWLLDEGAARLANVAGGVVAWQLHHLPWEK